MILASWDIQVWPSLKHPRTATIYSAARRSFFHPRVGVRPGTKLYDVMLMWNVAWVVGNLEWWVVFFSKWYLGISWYILVGVVSFFFQNDHRYILSIGWFDLIWFDYLVNWWGWVDLTFSCLNDLGIAWLIELMWLCFDNIGIAWLGWDDLTVFFKWYILVLMVSDWGIRRCFFSIRIW